MEIIKHYIIEALKKMLPGHSPDFLIVGAQKSGTTSLYYYLNQHPKIIGAHPKEVNYFGYDSNYSLGDTWYHRAFKDIKRPIGSYRYFEATPSYLYRSYVPQRIFNYNPRLKVIIVLREPVKRAYSSWNMYREFSVNKKKLPPILYLNYVQDRESNLLNELYGSDTFPSFEKCIDVEFHKVEEDSPLEEPSFIRRGIYYPQVKRYIELFGEQQVKIIGFKEFIDNKKMTLNSILTFLQLPESSWDDLKDETQNTRDYPEQMEEELKEKLLKFYRPHNEQLFDYLGRKLDW